MIFRQYDSEEATIREWARQLTASTKLIFRKYETNEATLTEWASLLNQLGYTFQTHETAKETLLDWERQLNILINNKGGQTNGNNESIN